MTNYKLRWVSAVVLLALLIPASTLSPIHGLDRPAQAQGAAHTFPETGKTIQGKFLDYWTAHGGLAQQGYPISDEFAEVSDTDGKPYTVQYYERAVFEAHPENQPPNDVLLSLLGNFLYHQKYPSGAPGQSVNTSPGALAFGQTGHRLGGKFLAYWQAHGGLAQQGYPISDEFSEVSDLNGKTYTVQYFERTVFEAHPENALPYDVLLSQIGTFRLKQKYPSGAPTGGGGGTGGTDGALPDLPNKAQPPLNVFHGCPSVGDGGDPALNIHKNRTDTAAWYNVAEQNILGLHWSPAIPRKPRSSWSPGDAADVARYEGIPIQVEGYLAGAKQEGPESPNCHSTADFDFHLWLVDDPSKDRSQSMVSEVTPRVRALHPSWSISTINPLVNGHTKVRLSGWLMFDQEHPEQIGSTRGTLWELHPILSFQVLRNGTWVALDNGGGGDVPGPQPPPIPEASATTIPSDSTPPVPPPGAGYQATASVSDPTPHQNGSVTVTGRLTAGNQGVAGAAMNTSWRYKTTTSSCSGTTDSSGSASCTRDIGRATIGYTVVIDVSFTLSNGGTVRTSTSFTPR